MTCESYVADSVKYVVEESDNVVMSDVVVAYNHILESIASRYHSLAEENKILDFVAVEPHEVDGKVVFAADYVIGLTPQGAGQTNYKNYSGLQREFGHTDYWCATSLLGKCDIYQGQCVGRDTTVELTRVVRNLYVHKPAAPYPYRAIWVEVSMIDAYHGVSNYSLWNYYSPECIEPVDINYYLKQVISVILLSLIPSDFYCNMLEVRSEFFSNTKSGGRHILELTYGKVKNVPNNDLIELPVIPSSSNLSN